MSAEDLPPPRPFFIAGDRGSFSSIESGSDSDSPVSSQRRAPRRARRASADWNASSLYSDIPPTPTSATPLNVLPRPPPSSYVFPFQSHPGNPDPGTSVPGQSRRSSVDSLQSPYQTFSQSSHPEPQSQPPSVDTHSPTVTRNHSEIPRVSSTSTFRAPFLSPASRPSSTLWSPPSYPFLSGAGPDSPSGSSTALALSLAKSKPPGPSTKIPGKLTKEDKPWMVKKAGKERAAWWITVFCFFLGVGGAAVLVWRGIADVELLSDSELCSVLDEDWSNGISDDNWARDVQLGGFGNGEFQICTADSKNSYIQDNQLYIMPTLTSDDIGKDSVLDGFTYKVDSCSTNNASACTAKSSKSGHTVINPVMSARLTTKGKHTIKYGKVEVRAKLPRGDWLWPAIWMLPQDDSVYGQWPMGGEIDIMEARGNGPDYGAQGYNFVRASLNYGPMASLITKIYGWWQVKRGGYNEGFHTYTLEWSKDWMRIYVDSRLHAMLDLGVRKEKQSFFERGNYPETAQNGSSEVVVPNPWEFGSWMAPYDQDFYLIINVAAGGTSGWFPDGVGDKPWHDGSSSAMYDFANKQDTWSATWPTNPDDRAFRIDSVKMWKLKDGSC
ncbi:concanavalin A-like lectin/glucanase domain-containing protein [Mucidula mucida]|nr:concanavalin A-like lectin/glucanase domain-containing protein [Mucidula mucida]